MDDVGYGGTLIEATGRREFRWLGRLLSVASLALWSTWIAWRITEPNGVVGTTVLFLELVAVGVAVVLTVALWHGPDTPSSRTSSTLLPVVLAATLGREEPRVERPHGDDDTGEVALARHGVRRLDPRRARRIGRWSWSETACNLVAIEGMRRMIFAAMLVVVLLSGQSPIRRPSWQLFGALVVSQVVLSLGHFLLSRGSLLPGARLRWSMASVGAGFGDGTSRSGLPIRWTTTMATIVVLNLAVSLRGLSDRWTHGLGPMAHDERVMAMVVSCWLVVVGIVTLRTLPRPNLGFYGATRRLEEPSTRRLALGATLAVAVVGFLAGALPGGVPA